MQWIVSTNEVKWKQTKKCLEVHQRWHVEVKTPYCREDIDEKSTCAGAEKQPSGRKKSKHEVTKDCFLLTTCQVVVTKSRQWGQITRF